LTDLGANFRVFSEQALILQGDLPDFDSAMRRFESSLPSQHVAGNTQLFQRPSVCSFETFRMRPLPHSENLWVQINGETDGRRFRVAARALCGPLREPRTPGFCSSTVCGRARRRPVRMPPMATCTSPRILRAWATGAPAWPHRSPNRGSLASAYPLPPADGRLQAQFYRMEAGRGACKAIVTLAASILTAI
jgi:hypothetical protein